MTQNERGRKMVVIGVTGGIGAGKSMIMDYMRNTWGACILRLDDVSRDLLLQGGRCYDEAVRLFGEKVVLKDGSLDRAAIAGIIFGDEEMRTALDRIIHPAVREETQKAVAAERKKGTALFAVEAALLLDDKKYEEICDEIWYIYADEETRKRRLAASRGYDAKRIAGTMKRQMSDEEFRARSDFVIDNSGDFEAAKAAVDGRL
ncbi:MAG: dephospho-CoA kinase, partial [Lachnospiraceae bacterium]|nr:dephospho-CoA kinase [Lachnospiraceae bacterium]